MDFDTSTPIWLQLVAEFTRRIATGAWPPGGKVPSVRELAAECGVNPNTVQRALAELERDHLAVAERTAGRFVTTDTDRVQTARLSLAAAAADAFVATARGLHLSPDAARTLLTDRWDAPPHTQPSLASQES